MPLARSVPTPPVRLSRSGSARASVGKLIHTRLKSNSLFCYINAIYFLSNFALVMVSVPLVRLIEQAVCQRYYQFHAMVIHTSGPSNVDEASCKIEPVQKEVARLVGWQVSLNAVSGMKRSTRVPKCPQANPRKGLLTAALYGLCADKYGRRAVLLLSCTGVWLGIAWTMVICTITRTSLRKRSPMRLMQVVSAHSCLYD